MDSTRTVEITIILTLFTSAAVVSAGNHDNCDTRPCTGRVQRLVGLPILKPAVSEIEVYNRNLLILPETEGARSSLFSISSERGNDPPAQHDTRRKVKGDIMKNASERKIYNRAQIVAHTKRTRMDFDEPESDFVSSSSTRSNGPVTRWGAYVTKSNQVMNHRNKINSQPKSTEEEDISTVEPLQTAEMKMNIQESVTELPSAVAHRNNEHHTKISQDALMTTLETEPEFKESTSIINLNSTKLQSEETPDSLPARNIAPLQLLTALDLGLRNALPERNGNTHRYKIKLINITEGNPSRGKSDTFSTDLYTITTTTSGLVSQNSVISFADYVAPYNMKEILTTKKEDNQKETSTSNKPTLYMEKSTGQPNYEVLDEAQNRSSFFRIGRHMKVTKTTPVRTLAKSTKKKQTLFTVKLPTVPLSSSVEQENTIIRTRRTAKIILRVSNETPTMQRINDTNVEQQKIQGTTVGTTSNFDKSRGKRKLKNLTCNNTTQYETSTKAVRAVQNANNGNSVTATGMSERHDSFSEFTGETGSGMSGDNENELTTNLHPLETVTKLNSTMTAIPYTVNERKHDFGKRNSSIRLGYPIQISAEQLQSRQDQYHRRILKEHESSTRYAALRNPSSGYRNTRWHGESEEETDTHVGNFSLDTEITLFSTPDGLTDHYNIIKRAAADHISDVSSRRSQSFGNISDPARNHAVIPGLSKDPPETQNQTYQRRSPQENQEAFFKHRNKYQRKLPETPEEEYFHDSNNTLHHEVIKESHAENIFVENSGKFFQKTITAHTALLSSATDNPANETPKTARSSRESSPEISGPIAESNVITTSLLKDAPSIEITVEKTISPIQNMTLLSTERRPYFRDEMSVVPSTTLPLSKTSSDSESDPVPLTELPTRRNASTTKTSKRPQRIQTMSTSYDKSSHQPNETVTMKNAYSSRYTAGNYASNSTISDGQREEDIQTTSLISRAYKVLAAIQQAAEVFLELPKQLWLLPVRFGLYPGIQVCDTRS